MPFLKNHNKIEPPWKKWEKITFKTGLRHAVFAVIGDKYIGEWKDNKKHGIVKELSTRILASCTRGTGNEATDMVLEFSPSSKKTEIMLRNILDSGKMVAKRAMV